MNLSSFFHFTGFRKDASPENYPLPEKEPKPRGCPDVDDLINYGWGILEPGMERYSEVKRHIQTCTPCLEIVETAQRDEAFSINPHLA